MEGSLYIRHLKHLVFISIHMCPSVLLQRWERGILILSKSVGDAFAHVHTPVHTNTHSFQSPDSEMA